MIKIGELRNRVTFQQSTVTQDSEGITTETWVDVTTVWGRVKDLKGREYFSAQQVQSEVTTEITIRYLYTIKSKMRALVGTRVFDIQSVIPDEKKREMTLMCVEVVS